MNLPTTRAAGLVRVQWLNDSNLSSLKVAGLAIAAILARLDDSFLCKCGVIVVSIIAIDCYWRSLGRTIGITEFASLIAVVQWLVAPLLAYDVFPTPFDKYRMYVDDVTYFSYAVPATAAFVGGLSAGRRPRGDAGPNRLAIWNHTLVSWAFLFLGFGLVGEAARRVFPGSFAFFFLVMANMKFAAMLMFYFSNWRYRWFFVLPLLCLIVLSARSSGMFHGLILWGGMGVFYFFLKHRRSSAEKLVILTLGFVAIMTIQIVKREYRDAVWKGQKTSFSKIAYEEMVEDVAFRDEDELRWLVGRFNQGWIVSRVMMFVPATRPYQGGSTFVRAVEAALLPRFLNPDKATAGGRENFQMLTGLPLKRNTAMGVSLLGECYGNFGVSGGTIAIFLLGVGFCWAVRIAKRLILRNSMVFFVLPVIFLEAVKAETDLVTVLNYIIKAGVLSLVIAYAASRLNISTAPGQYILSTNSSSK